MNRDAIRSASDTLVIVTGSRGVPARYGGFETLAEYLARSWQLRPVLVTPELGFQRGLRTAMRKIVGLRRLETPIATSVETFLTLISRRHTSNVFLVLNPANLLAILLLRLSITPVLLHVDGFDENRLRWSRLERCLIVVLKRLSLRLADALVADNQYVANSISRYTSKPIHVIGYGRCEMELTVNETGQDSDDTIPYLLVVQRIVPENQLWEILQGFVASSFRGQLVVVGGPPWKTRYFRRCQKVADSDSRVRLLGSVWNEEELCNLYRNAFGYVHGHGAGGTNPTLIHALSHDVRCIVFDSDSNRETTSGTSRYWRTIPELASLLSESSSLSNSYKNLNLKSWDEITEQYKVLFSQLLR